MNNIIENDTLNLMLQSIEKYKGYGLYNGPEIQRHGFVTFNHLKNTMLECYRDLILKGECVDNYEEVEKTLNLYIDKGVLRIEFKEPKIATWNDIHAEWDRLFGTNFSANT